MKNLPERFCIAPFYQLTTHPTGSYSPCPYLGGTSWKNSGSILDKWKNKSLEDLRKDFLENKQPDICSRCWHEEKNGKRSLRLRLFDPINFTSDYSIYSDNLTQESIINHVKSRNYLNSPKVLTIKNGNICNAKCRVCHPGDSSRWISDSKKLDLSIREEYGYNINSKEINWSDEQIQEILYISKNLVRLELFGGEPVYNKKVHKLLLEIVRRGYSENITLYINTNGSVDIVQKIPFIKEFKKVEIGVSIDGIGEHFDYIRHGLNYHQVKNNVISWKNYFTQNNVDFFIDSISTVEILNVFYLPELKKSVMEFLPLSPFWNLLIEPKYLFIKNMPDHVKYSVIEKLSPHEDMKEIINVINQDAELEHWNKFLQITSTIDYIRNENFSKTFPEFYSIINKI